MYRGKPQNMIFAYTLREYLCRGKFTQASLSRLCTVSKSAVSGWVCGKALPSLDALLIICEYVKMSGEERRDLVKMFMSIKRTVALTISNLVITEQENLLKKFKYSYNELKETLNRSVTLNRGVEWIKVKLKASEDIVLDFSLMSLSSQMMILRKYIKLANLPFTRV